MRHVWPNARAILFLKGRIRFHYPDGTKAKHNGGAPSVLIAFSLATAIDLGRCDLQGKLVYPNGGAFSMGIDFANLDVMSHSTESLCL